MTLLPVVERELRVASRQAWTYWGRALAGLGAVALSLWVVLVEARPGDPELAQFIFATATGVCFGLSLLAGAFFSADSLARERREGTLGLLFLTDLRGLDIALGKLAASSLAAVFCLLAALPILAIPLLLGGVAVTEYLRMVMVLLATQFASLTLGMLASTLVSESRTAGMVAVGLVIGLSGLVPASAAAMYALLAGQNQPWPGYDRYFGWESPFVAYSMAFDTNYKQHPHHYLAGLIFTLAAGIAALGWAARRLPYLGHEPILKRSSRQPTSIDLAPATAQIRARTAQLELGPLVWLANRRPRRLRGPWIFLALCAITWLLSWLVIGRDWNGMLGWMITSLFLHFCFKLWLASEAPRVFHEERRSGGMELLLSTPISTTDLVHGRLRALYQMFVGPLAVVVVLDLLFFSASMQGWSSDGISNDPEFNMFWLARVLILLVDAAALAWTGTWIGLSARGNRTTMATWARIIGLPIALLIFGLTLSLLIERIGLKLFEFRNSGQAQFWFWLAVNLAVSGFWWAWSAVRLNHDFRSHATRASK